MSRFNGFQQGLLLPGLIFAILLGAAPESAKAQTESDPKESPKSQAETAPAKQNVDNAQKENPDPQASRQKKISSYEQLVQAYEKQKIKFDKNDQAQSLIFQTRKGDFQGVMVVKWDSVNGVLHLIQTMPFKVEKKQRALYLEAAQTLNHGFLFPGLGINLANGGTYYRLSVPVAPRGYIHDYELGTYNRFVLNKAVEFMPTLLQVLDGKVTVDEVILFHQKRLREIADREKQLPRLSGWFSRESENGEWRIDFYSPGRARVYKGRELAVETTYTLKEDVCTFNDEKGPMATKGAGIYKVFVSKDKVSFRLNEDESKSRASVLSGGVWKRSSAIQVDPAPKEGDAGKDENK